MPDDPRPADASRYASRRWLTPDDWDGHEALAEYVVKHKQLPDEWLEVIREEQRNAKQTEQLATMESSLAATR